jgi:hypothetical protein
MRVPSEERKTLRSTVSMMCGGSSTSDPPDPRLAGSDGWKCGVRVPLWSVRNWVGTADGAFQSTVATDETRESSPTRRLPRSSRDATLRAGARTAASDVSLLSAQSGTPVDYVEMRARPTERVLQSAPDP